MAGSLISLEASRGPGDLVSKVLSDETPAARRSRCLPERRPRVLPGRLLAQRPVVEALRDALLERDELIGDEIAAVMPERRRAGRRKSTDTGDRRSSPVPRGRPAIRRAVRAKAEALEGRRQQLRHLLIGMGGRKRGPQAGHARGHGGRPYGGDEMPSFQQGRRRGEGGPFCAQYERDDRRAGRRGPPSRAAWPAQPRRAGPPLRPSADLQAARAAAASAGASAVVKMKGRQRLTSISDSARRPATKPAEAAERLGERAHPQDLAGQRRDGPGRAPRGPRPGPAGRRGRHRPWPVRPPGRRRRPWRRRLSVTTAGPPGRPGTSAAERRRRRSGGRAPRGPPGRRRAGTRR